MVKRALHFAFCSFVLVGLATATSAQSPRTSSPTAVPAAEAAISGQMDRWIAAFEAGDSQSLASIFTEDGIYAANTGQVLQGRAGIRAGVQSWFDGPIGQAKKATGGQLDVQRQLLRLKVEDRVAHSLMRFTIELTPPGCVLDAGHALLVWRQQPDGAWLIDSFLGNQDKKSPPNPCRGPTQPRPHGWPSRRPPRPCSSPTAG